MGSDTLQHHGIKGMKWGNRRFQYKSGELTPAGRQRYNSEVGYHAAGRNKQPQFITNTESSTASGSKKTGGSSGSANKKAESSTASGSKKTGGSSGSANKSKYHEDYINAHKKVDQRTKSNAELAAEIRRRKYEAELERMNAGPDKGKVMSDMFNEGQRAINSTKNIVDSVDRIYTKGKPKEENHFDELSDTELRNRINRLNMERQYADLTAKEVYSGKERMKDFLNIAGSALAVTASAASIALAIKQLRE